MKPLTPLLTAAMLSLLSLNACGQSEERKMSIQEQTEQRFQLNPNPKEAYRIRIKINDAPGPLKLMNDMTIRYMARNCSYFITSEFIGAKTHPTKRISTPIRQISENDYETVFYADAVLDEDYFREGICRWQPDGFGTSFKATGKPEETSFNVSGLMKYLLEQKSLTKYYRKAGYPHYLNDDGSVYVSHDGNGIVTSGRDSLTDYSPELQKDLFSITLTIEEL